MHSCTCRPRQTLADRINAIIAKYETRPCPSSTPKDSTRVCCIPRICSSPCLRGPSCPPRITCPAITSSSCCPQSTAPPPPSPGPGLCRYISKRDLCPALKGCLSLYKPPCGKPTCTPTPQYCPSVSCPGSRPSRVIISSSSKSRSSASCTRCNPCTPSSPTSGCPFCTPRQQNCSAYSGPRCAVCNPCSSSNVSALRTQSTAPCCCSSPTPCSSSTSSSRKKRLTALDDPPYNSHNLEREFSERFVRLDPCCCEIDNSSSSLDTCSFGNRYR